MLQGSRQPAYHRNSGNNSAGYSFCLFPPHAAAIRRLSPPPHPANSLKGMALGQRLFRAAAPLPLPFSAEIRCR